MLSKGFGEAVTLGWHLAGSGHGWAEPCNRRRKLWTSHGNTPSARQHARVNTRADLQLQARKYHNRHRATNICALAVARWNYCNGLLISLPLKPVQVQQCWGLCSTRETVVVLSNVLPIWAAPTSAFSGSPSGFSDQPESPHL